MDALKAPGGSFFLAGALTYSIGYSGEDCPGNFITTAGYNQWNAPSPTHGSLHCITVGRTVSYSIVYRGW